ncbi:MAG: leucine-rich repeat domain-containing protein [Candidatus Thorarchaeota archaeon]
MTRLSFQWTTKRGTTKTKSFPANATRIDLSGKGIQRIDLSPIVGLTRLRALMLYNNDIDELDLKPLSSIPGIEQIVLRKNELTNLDLSPLSQARRLVRLDLEQNNFQNLDLSPLSACYLMQKLDVSHNPLVELDVTPLFRWTNLKEFNVGYRVPLFADPSVSTIGRAAITRYKKRITWRESTAAFTQPISSAREIVSADVSDADRKQVIGVLKSVPRITIADLTKYSESSEDETRDLVFELVADGKVAGRFDPQTDEFVSLDAAEAAKRMQSEGPKESLCFYCGKPLSRTLVAGDKVVCDSCGTVNTG